jgi:predicted HD phosphohydrolase
MPASEFFEFWLFYNMEPFGERRGDIQAGRISKTVADTFRDPNRKPYELDMFMPKFFDEPVRQQTPEEQLAIIYAIQAAQKATPTN